MRPLRVCLPRPPLRAQPQAAFKRRPEVRAGSPGAPLFSAEAASGASHPAPSLWARGALRLGVWLPPAPGLQSPWAPRASRPPRKRKRATHGPETLGSPPPPGGGPLDRSTTTSPASGRPSNHALPPGYREGFLWKRGRDNGQFLSRKFVLTEREGALKYFNRSDIGHPHGLQVTYLKDNSTRNIFVYHEDGKLVPKLSRNYLQEGYMEKTGPKQTEGFRKRWFTMDDRRLMYFKDPLDAFARGEVFIGSRESGYTVLDGLPPSTQGHHWPHGITIVTPERRFLLACETESEQRAWMEALRKVVDRPMLPQEYAVEAHFKHKP
ncbi:ADAP1 [Cervus elaphus hippelaphus]|uniref:ADAP1 n=1 Tax=Cervus elaphus hippelaphus TaxID=46360 RepID=A0A212CY02_CEREH|nr:ADAP1 [Cervus elaphus hippelaphus]